MSAEGFLAAAQEAGTHTRCEHILCELAEAKENADYWTAEVERLERQ